MKGPEPKADALVRAEKFLQKLVTKQVHEFDPHVTTNFDTTALTGLRILSVEPGRVRALLHVHPRLQNGYGSLHGGCAATIVDTVSSCAVVSLGSPGGVSVSLSVNYVNPMPGGEDVEIDAYVVKVGSSIATLQVDLFRKLTGQLVARGTHVKFLKVSNTYVEDMKKKTAGVQQEEAKTEQTIKAKL